MMSSANKLNLQQCIPSAEYFYLFILSTLHYLIIPCLEIIYCNVFGDFIDFYSLFSGKLNSTFKLKS